MGMMQLKMIINPDKLAYLKQFVMKKFLPIPKNYAIECDAITEDGEPVAFLMAPDIPRLIRFMQGVKVQDTKGVAVCFGCQREAFSEILGDKVQLRPLKLEGVANMLGWGKDAPKI